MNVAHGRLNEGGAERWRHGEERLLFNVRIFNSVTLFANEPNDPRERFWQHCVDRLRA